QALACVPRREHQPVTKAVIDASVLRPDREAGVDDVVLGEAAGEQVIRQGAPVVRCVPQLPRLDGGVVHASTVAVGAGLCARRGLEVGREEDSGRVVGLQESFVLLALLYLALGGRTQLDASAVG